MKKEKVLVVGMGEVGRPLFELLEESKNFSVYAFDIREEKMLEVGQNKSDLPDCVDVMHICLPCLDPADFVNIVAGYVQQFKPKLVVINSTVQPGATVNVHNRCDGCYVAHSPIRGVHKSLEYMKWELKRWIKFIGGVNEESAQSARKHLEKAGFKTKVLRSCVETELAKLFETTYRAWMIACFQEMHRISRDLGADFDDVVNFLEDTHSVTHDRPVMFPSVIGGHCLIPNVELLLNSYDSEFLRLILKSNIKREKELKVRCISKEVERIRKRVEHFIESPATRHKI